MNYLKKRNGTYYFHKRVCKALAKNKNDVIRKSLRTKCYNTAKLAASLLNYCVNVNFEKGHVLTDVEIDDILYNFYTESLVEYSELESIRHEKNTIYKKGKMYEGSTKKAVKYHFKKHKKIDETRDFAEVKEYVEKEIVPIGLFDKEQINEMRSIDSFYWRIFKYYREILLHDLFEAVNKGVKNLKPNNTQVNNTLINDSQYSIEEDFEEVTELYFSHLKTKKKISDSSKEAYSEKIYIINEIFPNKKIKDLSVADFRTIEDYIIHLPSNRNKKVQTRDLSIHEQVRLMKNINDQRKEGVLEDKYMDLHTISQRTCNNYFERIPLFIKYCCSEFNYPYIIPSTVFVRYVIDKDSSTERSLLSDGELSKVFSSFDYFNSKFYKTLKEDPLKIYGVFLTMYLGLRPSEAGQLMVDDLNTTKDKNDKDIYFISVSKENSSKVKSFDEIKQEKTKNARRKLPLTDIFVNDLRLVDFIKKRKKEKHKFVFVDIDTSEDSNKVISNKIKNTVRRCEDTFNNKLKKLDIDELECKSYYSMRHSFANKIKHIPEALRDKRGEQLMGHAGDSDSELFNRYGNKYFEPDFLYEILENIEYDGLNLSLIKDRIESYLST